MHTLKRNVTEIIIHCSDSDNAAHDNVKTLDEWHRARGFSSVGYHFIITKKGVEQGRPVDVVGAHCKDHNDDTIGICVTGRNAFTVKQMDMLSNLVAILKMVYPTIKSVKPHKFYNSNKTCPNFKHELFGDYV
jgi:N-acetyl-anhydromuramyl-L-alanine amidase AmpD